jgi:hypothetical protein
MIYPLLCVHEALLDCLESSDGRARAFLRAGYTMKLVSVHRSDRFLISNESHRGRAEKEPASRYSPGDRSNFPAGPCGRTRFCARFAPPCAGPPIRRECPRAALMPAGLFSTRRSRRASCRCQVEPRGDTVQADRMFRWASRRWAHAASSRSVLHLNSAQCLSLP